MHSSTRSVEISSFRRNRGGCARASDAYQRCATAIFSAARSRFGSRPETPPGGVPTRRITPPRDQQADSAVDSKRN
ncbi:unnamed protein product, partial [Iphiclides podalirius]